MDSDCLNPTAVSERNTAVCESLASKVASFTNSFFGVVTKTDTDGKITWTLPCGLDTGLISNPRGFGEGVACYFFRLLYDNIQELKGPQGDGGLSGINGENAVS